MRALYDFLVPGPNCHTKFLTFSLLRAFFLPRAPHLQAAGGAARAAADALGARAALAAELPKELDGGTGGMAEDAEEIPRRPVFSVGAREKLKTRGGSLSSEGANAAVQAEKSTPIKVLSSLEYSYALI